MFLPPTDVLSELYRQLPGIVLHLTTDGIVLHANPETSRVTGFDESELRGKNFWTLLFPGKLFAQVPRFISLLHPSPLLKDVPMTIRTKAGKERTIAFSRFLHSALPHGGIGQIHSFIVFGIDLTDRLLDSDRHAAPDFSAHTPDATPQSADSPEPPKPNTFGPNVGNAGAIDSETVTPIAISPRPPGTTGPCPIEQVREALARVDTHFHCTTAAYNDAESQSLASLHNTLPAPSSPTDPASPVPSANPLPFQFVIRSDDLHLAACAHTLNTIHARVEELLNLYRLDLP